MSNKRRKVRREQRQRDQLNRRARLKPEIARLLGFFKWRRGRA